MSSIVQDALGILKGADTAATGYLRKSTSPQLVASFRPVVEEALQKTGATRYWKEIFDTYNKFTLKPVNSDLSGFVTGRAIDGIFYYVADRISHAGTGHIKRKKGKDHGATPVDQHDQ